VAPGRSSTDVPTAFSCSSCAFTSSKLAHLLLACCWSSPEVGLGGELLQRPAGVRQLPVRQRQVLGMAQAVSELGEIAFESVRSSNRGGRLRD